MMKHFVFAVLFILLIVFGVCFLSKNGESAVVIKFSSWGSQSETALLIPLIKEFEKKNPDIKVEFVHIPQNYFQKLHLLFASNIAPDVVFINNYYAPKYVKAGLLEDLTPYIKQDDYFNKALSGFTFNGKIYAIPRDISDMVIYYNKDMFRKNKLPFPKNDWTMKDFFEIATKLSKDTDNDGKNDVWGISFETDPIFYLPYLMSNGSGILSDDGEKIIINEPSAVEILQNYADMANKYNIAPKKSQSASLTMAQLFLQQKLAMHLSGRWLVPKYRQEAKFDWDVVEFPNGNSGSVVNIDSSGYALSKSSKHKQEAIKFIKFLSSKESLDALSQSGLIVPARIDSAYSDYFLDPSQKPKNASAFLEAAKNGKATPVNYDYQRLIDNLYIILEPVFIGQKKAVDGLSTAALYKSNLFK